MQFSDVPRHRLDVADDVAILGVLDDLGLSPARGLTMGVLQAIASRKNWNPSLDRNWKTSATE